MDHRLLDLFTDRFPMWKDMIINWGCDTSHKPHTLRVTLNNHDILIFEYWGEGNWRLETLKVYTDRLIENDKKKGKNK